MSSSGYPPNQGAFSTEQSRYPPHSVQYTFPSTRHQQVRGTPESLGLSQAAVQVFAVPKRDYFWFLNKGVRVWKRIRVPRWGELLPVCLNKYLWGGFFCFVLPSLPFININVLVLSLVSDGLNKFSRGSVPKLLLQYWARIPLS